MLHRKGNEIGLKNMYKKDSYQSGQSHQFNTFSASQLNVKNCAE